MTTNTSYIDAEVRGRLRQWKAQLGKRYGTVTRLLYEEEATVRDCQAFCGRGSTTGRRRAFARINRALVARGAVLEGLRIDGKDQIAAWSILKSRDSVACTPEGVAGPQDCVTVNYVVIGSFAEGLVHRGDGLWTLEIPDHALGRLLHRSTEDAAGCIAVAHHAALRLRHDDVIPGREVKPDFQFLLPAGPGAFVCSISGAEDLSLRGAPSLHVLAHTWLSNDMLYETQVPLVDDGTPGARLGDDWLLPAPLRVTAEAGARQMMIATWAPGMPETLAAPQGRA